jgi:hypothetical protein
MHFQEPLVFLVQLPPGHSARWLFLHCDPHADGCPYKVVPDVELEEGDLMLGGVDGDDFTEPVLGRSIADRSLYKRFQSYARLKAEGFEYLSGAALELSSWRSFIKSPPLRPGGNGNAVLYFGA